MCFLPQDAAKAQLYQLGKAVDGLQQAANAGAVQPQKLVATIEFSI